MTVRWAFGAKRAQGGGTRSVGWVFDSSDICFYCENRIEDFRSVRFRMPSSSISLHEGECWDLFVVGVFVFNDRLVDFEATKPN